MTDTHKAGDFTSLANDYSQHRPDYCPLVLKALLGLLDKPKAEIDFVDLGAGTGIWMSMVENSGVKSVYDLRDQLGPEKFESFLDFFQNKVSGLNIIKTNFDSHMPLN